MGEEDIKDSMDDSESSNITPDTTEASVAKVSNEGKMKNERTKKLIRYRQFLLTVDEIKKYQNLTKKLRKEGKSKKEVAKEVDKLFTKPKDEEKVVKKKCLHCRRKGHTMIDCPQQKSSTGATNLFESSMKGSTVCFKCGSTEHVSRVCTKVRGDKFEFANCFVCGEDGHISRQCPKNSNGIYIHGGGCRECGENTHLAQDCPNKKSFKSEVVIKEKEIKISAIVDPFASVEDEVIQDIEASKPKKPTARNGAKRVKF